MSVRSVSLHKTRFGWSLAFALPLLLSACDECAGTPSCHNFPEISYSGQFIDHNTGSPVAGVSIAFVRRSGIDIIGDTVRGLSDGDGFFTLRVGSIYNGTVVGDLLVTPPPPFPPFTIPSVTLATSTVRGDGGYLGRLVVNPYLLLVGHVRDRKTLTPIPEATVKLRRIGGGKAAQDSMTFVTDFGGQFSWEPEILQPGTIDAVFEITAPGYPRTYVVSRAIPLKYVDLDMSFIILPVGWGLTYSGRALRRGSNEHLSGTVVEFRRISGIAVQPAQVTVNVDGNGGFPIPVEPQAEGMLTAELRIVPPGPMPAETVRVDLRTSDNDETQVLGPFGYGAQVFLEAELRDAITGAPLPQGTEVTMKRTGGLPLAWNPARTDGDTLSLKTGGRLAYQAPTPDSGAVRFDMIVRLPAPFAWDTVRNVNVPARYSDSAFVAGTIAVRRRQGP